MSDEATTDFATLMSPSPGAGAELLDDLYAWLGRYIAFPSEHAHVAVTLWAAHTHLVHRFESTPRLALISPEPECGKTRTLELLELVCPGGWLIIGPSAAALFRRVDMAHAAEHRRPVTLLVDEADTVWKSGRGDESAEAIRQILNQGHRITGLVPRAEPAGNTFKLREFRVFAPAAIASKGNHIPETITSRALAVPMRRRAPDETVKPYRQRLTRPEGEQLRGRLADWAASVADLVGDPWPDMPDGVTDRQVDVWEPLLAVADLADGGDWPRRARQACAAFTSAGRDVTGQSVGIRLLADLRDTWPRPSGAPAGTCGTGGTCLASTVPHVPHVPHRATEETLRALHALDEAPWGDWYGHPLNSRDLARLLSAYGISSDKVRIGDRSVRGYHCADFHDAWRRYLPSTPLPVRSARSARYLASALVDLADLTDTPPGEGDPDVDASEAHADEPAEAPCRDCWQLTIRVDPDDPTVPLCVECGGVTRTSQGAPSQRGQAGVRDS